jgi:hypothetical protein
MSNSTWPHTSALMLDIIHMIPWAGCWGRPSMKRNCQGQALEEKFGQWGHRLQSSGSRGAPRVARSFYGKRIRGQRCGGWWHVGTLVTGPSATPRSVATVFVPSYLKWVV